METQRNPRRQILRLSLATLLAAVAIIAGLITSLMNIGVIAVSNRVTEEIRVVQWEQINVPSSQEAMKIWQQINSGANMETLAKKSSLEYMLIDGENPPKRLDVIRDQVQEIDSGELGPIVKIGDQFCVTRVTKRSDDP